MRCIYCGSDDSKVIDSRSSDGGMSIRRRRQCFQCGKRFTTYEKIERAPLMVVKRDGSREQFNAEKLRTSIERSTIKLPISTDKIDAVTTRVEIQAYNKNGREISSADLGELVMQELKKLSDVAYVRFAAVYRKFTDLDMFIQEVQKISQESGENNK